MFCIYIQYGNNPRTPTGVLNPVSNDPFQARATTPAAIELHGSVTNMWD